MQEHALIFIVLVLAGAAIGGRSVGNPRSHPNWPFSMETICGEALSDRIIGGKNAKLGQFPWMARLHVSRT